MNPDPDSESRSRRPLNPEPKHCFSVFSSSGSRNRSRQKGGGPAALHIGTEQREQDWLVRCSVIWEKIFNPYKQTNFRKNTVQWSIPVLKRHFFSNKKCFHTSGSVKEMQGSCHSAHASNSPTLSSLSRFLLILWTAGLMDSSSPSTCSHHENLVLVYFFKNHGSLKYFYILWNWIHSSKQIFSHYPVFVMT